MKCSKCDNKGVYKSTSQVLCKEHFLNYFETKVFRTINRHNLFNREDKICVAASGGKDSLALLYIVRKYCKKKEIEFFALAIDEGIQGYRDKTLDDLEEFCNKYEIKLKVVSFKEKFGSTLDKVRDKAIKELGKKPCTVCGIFRRTLLNREARELKATKLATGHNLDDASQSFFMNVIKGNIKMNASLGPVSGITQHESFVTRVKPLYFILEQETRLFCFLKGFKVDFTECPNIDLSFRAVVRDQLNKIEEKSPGSKAALVKSFLEIMPALKEMRKSDGNFSICERCGDACSKEICNTCKMEEELCLEVR